MEILKNVLAIDLFLYLKDFRTLIISDTHIGFEESLHKQGYIIPKSGLKDIILRIEKAVHTLKKKDLRIDTIILNGDLVHSFSKHSMDEKYALKQLIEFLGTLGQIIIIKGNHDKIISFMVKKDMMILPNVRLGDILIAHGDVIDKDSDEPGVRTIIIGHEHPSVVLQSGLRREQYKCLLKGKYKKKDLIVMPSSNTLIEGSDVLKEKLLTPYITDINGFEIFAIADQIYDFGKISRLRKKLD